MKKYIYFSLIYNYLFIVVVVVVTNKARAIRWFKKSTYAITLAKF
jgi:hypothetical protein